MSVRDQSADTSIQAAKDTPVYPDQLQITHRLARRMTEGFMFQGTGAAGAGFAITGIPFKPAIIEAVNQLGASPAVWLSLFPNGKTAVHVVTILAVASSATPPVISGVPGNWTVTFPVGMAPNGEILTGVIYGMRDTDDGSL